MSGKIPQSFIDDLLVRVDLVSLIDACVPLRKKGANYMACCPFHQEKTPSFSVSPQKQIYYCFGCGMGGNAIRFLMEYERLGFTEALSYLAKQVGVVLPIEGKEETSASAVYDALQQAASFYQQQLKRTPTAVAYLKSRGITGLLAKEYQLGFAPEGWHHLESEYPPTEKNKQVLLQAGLLVKQEAGKTYDRFRSRIMFPIRDSKGRVIAFGGRVLVKEEPKYLNSPETPVFHKGRELYGLYEARRVMRDISYFIVVEGYMDVLALAQYGIRNVVGTLGTATTADHFIKLLRYTKKIVFCFDGDRAGREAAWRALQVALPLLEDNVEIRFMFLPQQDDPDSFIRREGKEQFLLQVKSAHSFSDFMLRHLTSTIDLATLEGKAALSHAITPLLDKMPEGALKQLMYDNLSRLVPLQTMQLRSFSKKKSVERAPVEIKKKSASRGLTLMQMVIMLLLHYPQLATAIPDNIALFEWELPGSDLLKEILVLLRAHPTLTAAALLEHWADKPESRLISALLMKEHFIPEEEIENEFPQLLLRLEQQHKENKVEKMLLKAKVEGLTSAERQALQALISLAKA